jgi:hypothetical protein
MYFLLMGCCLTLHNVKQQPINKKYMFNSLNVKQQPINVKYMYNSLNVKQQPIN